MILVYIIIGLILFLVGWGLYITVGEGKKEINDTIKEHAKMHELGIAHTHKEKYVKLKDPS